jgi:hypothetical protein
MLDISIAKDALAELRARMGRVGRPAGIRIMGPMSEDPRAPSSVEEAWMLERLYGPPQKWVLHIVPVDELEDEETDVGEEIYLQTVNGIPIAVLTSKPVERLRVALHGDAIRIYEVDV